VIRREGREDGQFNIEVDCKCLLFKWVFEAVHRLLLFFMWNSHSCLCILAVVFVI
jgi:hypothetical protein